MRECAGRGEHRERETRRRVGGMNTTPMSVYMCVPSPAPAMNRRGAENSRNMLGTNLTVNGHHDSCFISNREDPSFKQSISPGVRVLQQLLYE